MFVRLANLFKSSQLEDAEPTASKPFFHVVDSLNTDPYLMVADKELRLISVFDDLRYDRADLDILSAPMRQRALSRLKPLGFVQRSGSVLESRIEDIRIHMPKFRALGASPYDVLADTPQRPQDYVLLTPTQSAAVIITAYPIDKAMALLEALVVNHPVNLMRLNDFLEPSQQQAEFNEAFGYLVYLQRKAVSKEPLKSRRALS